MRVLRLNGYGPTLVGFIGIKTCLHTYSCLFHHIYDSFSCDLKSWPTVCMPTPPCLNTGGQRANNHPRSWVDGSLNGKRSSKIVGLLQARQFACIGVYVFTCFNKGDVFLHMHEIQVWGDSTWLTTPQRKLA